MKDETLPLNTYIPRNTVNPYCSLNINHRRNNTKRGAIDSRTIYCCTEERTLYFSPVEFVLKNEFLPLLSANALFLCVWGRNTVVAEESSGGGWCRRSGRGPCFNQGKPAGNTALKRCDRTRIVAQSRWWPSALAYRRIDQRTRRKMTPRLVVVFSALILITIYISSRWDKSYKTRW